MRNLRPHVLWIALCLAVCGCRSMERPSLCWPGPSAYQQQKAQRFDPYPENDIAPPVVGGRPIDYMEPVAEPSRARWDPRTWVQRWGW